MAHPKRTDLACLILSLFNLFEDKRRLVLGLLFDLLPGVGASFTAYEAVSDILLLLDIAVRWVFYTLCKKIRFFMQRF